MRIGENEKYSEVKGYRGLLASRELIRGKLNAAILLACSFKAG